MAEPTDRRCSSVKFANLCRPLLLIAAVAIAAAIVAAVTPAPAQDAAAIPDPQVTPGAVTSTDRIAYDAVVRLQKTDDGALTTPRVRPEAEPVRQHAHDASRPQVGRGRRADRINQLRDNLLSDPRSLFRDRPRRPRRRRARCQDASATRPLPRLLLPLDCSSSAAG
jgi:hypothetical protein